MKVLAIPHFEQQTGYSCIPACLQQVFAYYNEQVSQEEILNSLDKPERGMSIPAAGTFAKKQGLNPTIITNNTNIFDLAWFDAKAKKLTQHLEERKDILNEYNQSVIEDFLEYLKMDGQINFETVGKDLLVRTLSNNVPVIMELSSTILYKKNQSIKEIEGHGVVIAGFDKNKFMIVDPDSNNPYDKSGVYWVPVEELMTSFFALEGKSLLFISEN